MIEAVKKSTEIVDKIGMPALLEQAAEECVELAHACLKLARIKRGENPTPVDGDEVVNDICEEASDVMVCINKLVESGLLSYEAIDSVAMTKEARWKERLDISNK